MAKVDSYIALLASWLSAFVCHTLSYAFSFSLREHAMAHAHLSRTRSLSENEFQYKSIHGIVRSQQFHFSLSTLDTLI